MANQGEKRAHSDSQDSLEGIKAVLFDIEGTTTPINFVKEKLFNYVKDNASTYLENHFDDEECQQDIDSLRNQADADKEVEGCVAIPAKEEEKEKILDALVSNICWQVDRDAKNSALKQFQGHMYREAYKTGKILGQVYDDVVEAFKSLTSAGKQVYIYSSGSVEAQKLLFGYTEKGDLTAYISGYYDTNTGMKNDKESYTKIASDMGVQSSEVAFFTDVPSEGRPASESGMKVFLVEREGNAPLSDEDKSSFNTITSFTEFIQVDVPAKRVEVDNEESNGAESNGAVEDGEANEAGTNEAEQDIPSENTAADGQEN